MPSNNPLDLYAKFEDLIPFENELNSLHNRYIDLVLELGAKRVLDVGCGGGKFLSRLKEKNIRSKGIDLSAEMVKKASGLGVDASKTDLCDIDEKFDLITAIFDVVNYLEAGSLERFFECANSALKENGYFLFDSNTLFGFTDVAVGSLVLSKNGIHSTVESFYQDKKLFSSFIMFTPNSDGFYCKESSEIVQYFYTTKELTAMLKKAGLKVLGKFDIFLYGEAKSDKTLWVTQKIA